MKRMVLRETLEKLFEELKSRDPKLTTYRICLEQGINHGNFKAALLGERPFSNTYLEKLAESEHIPYTAKQLKAMRALDEYGPETIEQAHKVVEGAGGAKGRGLAGASGMLTPPLQERMVKLAEAMLAGYSETLCIPCEKCDGSAPITMSDLATKNEFISACVLCGSPIHVKNEDIVVFRQAQQTIESLRRKMDALRRKPLI